MEYLVHRGKALISFRKGSDSMFFVLLHPKVPTSSQGFEEGEVQEPIRKVLALKTDQGHDPAQACSKKKKK